jgi:drug/metabolite transporter (DMT)-like permease
MSSSRAALPWLAYLSLSASMALVGSYVGFSKLLVAALPVFLLAWLRFGIAAVAMASWTKRRADEAPMTRHDLGLLFLESFFGNFLFSICMLFGMALSTALAAGVIMAALPGVTALLSWLLLKEKIAKRIWAGIACAVGGIALVAFSKHSGESAQSLSILGIALLLGAVFCEASYVVIGKKLSAKLSPKRISALINLWGLALVTPFGVWQALSFDFATVNVPMWGLLVFYALAASMGTVWLWMTGLRQVPAAQAGVFTVMLPITSAAVGVLFLGEHVSSAQAAAFALALAGVVLATWPKKMF